MTDDLTGDTWTIDELAVGATETYTTSHVVTEADILAGEVVNEATAAGDEIPDPKDPDDPKKPEGGDETTDETDDVDATLTVVKTTTSTPANGATYALGETIEYQITVTNDGNVTYRNVVVTDDLTLDTWTIDELAVGATETFTTSYTVTEDDLLAGHVLNVATATGDEIPDPKDPEDPPKPDGRDDEDNPTDSPKPSLFVSKRTTTEPANGTAYGLGETIGYSIVVTNNGNVTITDIVVTDELTGDEWTIDSLEPGASSEAFTAEYVVTEADILAGEVVNVATATGVDPEGEEPEVIPGEEENPTVDPNPSMTIEKTLTNLPAKGYFTVGETAEFDIIVSNNGNLTLTNVTVTEELEGATILSGEGYSVNGNAAVIATLIPGATVVVKATYTVTEDDLGKEIFNSVTVSGEGPEDPEDPTRPYDPDDGRDDEEIPTDEAIEISGVKTWSDLDNAYATRPDSITLRLTADGVEIGSTTANADGGWAYSFTKLPVHTAEGTEIVYDVTEDAVVGYDTVYGENNYDITNELQSYTLSIRYWYEAVDGEAAAPTVNRTCYYGESYNVVSPVIEGFSVNAERVSGVVTGNVVYDVVYTRNSYTLTVNYVFQNGATAAPSYNRTLFFGDFYMHDSPVLSGYTASQRVILGTMPGRNLVYTVIYVPDTVDIVIDEYGVPLGIGNVEMNVGECFE